VLHQRHLRAGLEQALLMQQVAQLQELVRQKIRNGTW
jgi:hypothetical protein